MNAAFGDGDYEWGGGSASGLFGGKGEFLRIVGDESSNQEDGEDVEDENAPECQFNGLGNYSSGVLSFSDSHTYHKGKQGRVIAYKASYQQAQF